MKYLILLLPLHFILSGCTSDTGFTTKNTERPIFEGNVFDEAVEIYSHDSNLYSCDVKQKEMVLEITQAVEKQRDEILKLIEKSNQDKAAQNDEIKLFRLGGFQFYENTHQKSSKNEWLQSTYGWNDIYEIFQKVRNSKSDLDWIRINAAARSLILDDGSRILRWNHPGLRSHEGSRVQRIFSILDKCAKTTTCTSLDFKVSDSSWLRDGLPYSKALDFINNEEESVEKRRKLILLMQKLLERDNYRYSIYKTPSLSLKNNELLVPMNLKIFGVDKDKVAQLLQDKWSQHGLKVQILHSEKADVFEVFVKNTPGQRPYVLRNENKMVLFEPEGIDSLFHEFGHVLGLPDGYYTSFNTKNCKYTNEINSGDIMSMSETGQVLPSHIEQIKNAYGIQD